MVGGEQHRPLAEHLAELKAVGYTIFRGHLDSTTVSALRDVLEPVFTAAFEVRAAFKYAVVLIHGGRQTDRRHLYVC